MSDNKIQDIKDRKPNPGVVRHLEQLLESARKGEIRSLVAICGWDDDSVSHSWVLGNRNTYRRILAEVVLLQHDFTVNIEMREGDSILYKNITDME